MKYTMQLLFFCALMSSNRLFAEEIRVAVASNFYQPMQEIAREFEADSGHQVVLSPGSSGKLYAQIVHGAPFHAFFSADREKPEALVTDGFGVAASVFTYAVGKLVLWSPTPDVNVESMLRTGNYNRLAMANSRLAPYGKAAMDTLTALSLNTPSEEQKWVRGENIAQTWHFVSSGNTELGLVAMSQVIANGVEKGSAWVVPQSLYEPIRQDALLLTNSLQNDAAFEFMDYVKSRPAREIITSFGYTTHKRPGQEQ